MMTAEERCKGTRLDGAPCRARALGDSRFCFWHDPAGATRRQAGLAPARGVGTRCPRCASRDVEWAEKLKPSLAGFATTDFPQLEAGAAGSFSRGGQRERRQHPSPLAPLKRA